MKRFWQELVVWMLPRQHWRRYRVTPRANPAAFRQDMLRGIQFKLRRARIAGSRQIAGRTTL